MSDLQKALAAAQASLNRCMRLRRGAQSLYLAPQAPPAAVPAPSVEGLTVKQAWWAGARAALGIEDDTPRAEVASAFISAAERAAPPDAVADGMRAVTDAMRSDPGYAWSWHCNIAMAFVDEGGDYVLANHAAARFMKLLANVEPAHELPAKQAPLAAVDRTGMTYYRKTECKAASAEAPDCICWTPEQAPPAAVADGYALVPVEPTTAMLDAGIAWGGIGLSRNQARGRISAAWKYMLAAALAERKGGE